MSRSNFSKIFRFLLILVPILFSATLAQKKFDFQVISVADGLSSSVVTAIHQDKYGFLWICTNDGLNRYDGYDFKVFKNNPGDPTSLQFNFLTSVTESKDGILWFGSQGAIRYDRSTNTFSSVPISIANSNSGQLINYILFDSRERLWITTERHSLQLYDKKANSFVIIPLDLEGKENKTPQGDGRFAGSMQVLKELKNGSIVVSDTSNGIFIFDENTNKLRPYFSTPGIDPKGIFDIYEDTLGRLWLAGLNSVYRYNPATFQMLEYKVHKGEISGDIYYSGFITSKTGELFITSDRGVFRLVNSTRRLNAIDLNAKNLTPRYTLKDKFDIYWIPTLDRGLLKFDPEKEPFRFYQFETGETVLSDISCIASDPSKTNQFFVATRHRKIYRFNVIEHTYDQILDLTQIDGMDNYKINAIAVDFKGHIWLADDLSKKLIRFDKNSKSYTAYSIPNANFQSLAPFIYDMKIDSKGFPWIVSDIGILVFNPDDQSFQTLPMITNKKISGKLLTEIRQLIQSNNPLAAIEKAGENTILEAEFSLPDSANMVFVSFGEGQVAAALNMFDYGWLEDGSGNQILAMSEIKETLGAGGGYKNRIALKNMRLGPGNYTIKFTTDVGHSYGNFNVPAAPDSIWYGIRAISLLNDDFNTALNLFEEELDSTKYPAYEFPRHFTFSKKYSNTIWISTFSTGLFRYNYRDSTYFNYTFGPIISPSNVVFSSYEDSQGIVWLSTAGGLIRIDPDKNEYEQFHEDDGLASNAIFFITEDFNGNLWLGTSGGISRLNKNAPRDKWYFVSYDSRDGLQNYPNNPAVFQAETGEIFYGGNAGLNAFKPGEANKIEPMPVIFNLTLSDVPIHKTEVEVKSLNGILDAIEIQLNYDQNDLSFEFASLHFSRPYKNKIAYKLTGFNKEWIHTDRRFVSFTNLDPGSYEFRVRAANGDGIWSSHERVLRIIIYPPWWRTNWAYIAYFFFFFGFLFIFRRFELNRKMKNAKLKESQLRAEAAELQAKASEMQARAAEAQNQAIQSESDRKTKELEDARALQLSMLPQEIPEISDLDIAVFMKTATEVGGDYYDFSWKSDGSINVAIGDATGHGMKAGTLVAAMKALFTSNSANMNMTDFFNSTNQALKEMHLERVMMGFGMLNIFKKNVIFANAGMPPLYHYHKDSGDLEEIKLTGMPLGAMAKTNYDALNLKVSSGDALLMLSDGMPEQLNASGEMFGYERIVSNFLQVADKPAQEIIDHLKDSGSDWIDDRDPDDDVTFVVVKYN